MLTKCFFFTHRGCTDHDPWTEEQKNGAKNGEADHRTQRTPHVSKLPALPLPWPAPQLASVLQLSYAMMLRLLTFFFPISDFKIQNPPSTIAFSLFSTGARPKPETETSRRPRGVSEPGRNPLKNPRVGDGRILLLGRAASRRGKHPKHQSLVRFLHPPPRFHIPLGAGRFFPLYLLATAPLLAPVACCLCLYSKRRRPPRSWLRSLLE